MTNRNDIYCKFGITAEAAQLLELELGTLLLGVKGIKNKLWHQDKKNEANKLYGKINKSTLGMLFSEVKNHITIEKNTEEIIIEALKIRNVLFHQFYWKHNFKIESSSGRDKMMEDLENMHKKLLQAYQLLQNMSESVLEKLKNNVKNT